jgi:hypothetical protein
MQIYNLYDKHVGEDIYIVGTGPSMQFFPASFFEGRVTIGLNQAYRIAPMMYSITVHPELVREYERLPEKNPTQWCIKAWKAPMNVTPKHPHYYVFQAGDPKHGHNLDYIEKRVKNLLYQGRGVQQTAMNLACHMGARSIILVGVDMCSLDGDHHGINQHTRFCGIDPDDVYREYRLFTDHAREAIWKHHKIPVLTLSPFIGLKNPEEDAIRLREQRGVDKLPEAKDISTRNRRRIDKPR